MSNEASPSWPNKWHQSSFEETINEWCWIIDAVRRDSHLRGDVEISSVSKKSHIGWKSRD
jgi:hypothetical protein